MTVTQKKTRQCGWFGSWSLVTGH